MAGNSYSRHQQGIIKRHYETAGDKAVQRLQELVTEIYLCETDKKADRLWASVGKFLGQIKAKPEVVAKIIPERDVAALADFVGKLASSK